MPDILARAADGMKEKPRPSMLVSNPEKMKENELWRCGRCGGTVRTNEDIKKGARCKRCGSPLVVSAHPSLLESLWLFIRTGTIYLMEKKSG